MSKKKSRREEERQGLKAHSHRDPKGEWSVRIIRAGSPTGPAYIDFRFPTEGGGFGQVQVPYSELRHPKRLLDRLADHLPVFPRNIEARDAAQADFINKLVKSNNSPIDIVPERTGFIDKDSFATFSEIVTRDGRRTPLRRIGHSNMDAPIDVRGTKEGTCKDVLELGRQSTYLAFALGVGFAACLPSYLTLYAQSQESGGVLTETAVFNFSGHSSSGKTSICLAAMSTAGSPQRAGTMNFSARGLSELAADSNDLPLVIDDTEKGEDDAAYMVHALKAIVHTVSGGRSKIISRGVDQSKFPQLRWRTMGLSSSPKAIQVLAAERNWEMTPGDMVRLFDIRVPGPEKGGIFDRIRGSKRRRARKSVELIAQLERGYTNNHGHIYPQWVTFLMAKNRSPRINQLIAEFIDAVGSTHDGWEKRFARKFGLVYAAIVLGIKAGILPSTKEFALDVVSKCHNRARRAAMTPSEAMIDAARRLNRFITRDGRMVDARRDGGITSVPETCVAIRYVRNGRLTIALLDKALNHLLPSKRVKATFTTALREAGVIPAGHGHAGTIQERLLPISIDGEINERPRIWPIDARKLSAFALAKR